MSPVSLWNVWLFSILGVAGYACLLRLVYLRGDYAGWRRGFDDGIALEKSHHKDRERLNALLPSQTETP